MGDRETGRLWRGYLLQGVKLAGGALAAMLLAGALSLRYSATAGIITLLSILGTKRETLTIAAGRLAAYLTALAVAAVSYRLLGFTVWGYAAYLLVFAVICCRMGWMYALAMVSVLMSHFLAEGTMAPAMLLNETLLFLVGCGCGILINLTLRADEMGMRALRGEVDGRMKSLLVLTGSLLTDPDARVQRRQEAESELRQLNQALRRGTELAIANRDNRLLRSPVFDLRYVEMRAGQRDILAQILSAMDRAQTAPRQQQAVEGFFRKVAQEYSTDNDVAELLAELARLLGAMKTEPLPQSREEFESRALLYYALLRMEDFLEAKRRFARENSP
ncbi:MAG: aromatic acid exporter family protein [Aristaeellaceae bacterium]